MPTDHPYFNQWLKKYGPSMAEPRLENSEATQCNVKFTKRGCQVRNLVANLNEFGNFCRQLACNFLRASWSVWHFRITMAQELLTITLFLTIFRLLLCHFCRRLGWQPCRQDLQQPFVRLLAGHAPAVDEKAIFFFCLRTEKKYISSQKLCRLTRNSLLPSGLFYHSSMLSYEAPYLIIILYLKRRN